MTIRRVLFALELVARLVAILAIVLAFLLLGSWDGWVE